eukprot:3833084-Rhodomonas_salina.1
MRMRARRPAADPSRLRLSCLFVWCPSSVSLCFRVSLVFSIPSSFGVSIVVVVLYPVSVVLPCGSAGRGSTSGSTRGGPCGLSAES